MNPVPRIPPAPVTPAPSPTVVALRAGTSVRVLVTTPSGPPRRTLSLAEAEAVAALPPELEWLGNLPSPRTRRAYRADVEDFRRFAGLPDTAAFRATGITNYLQNGGLLERAQQMAAHASPQTTRLYDRTNEEMSLGEFEKIHI